MTLEDIRRRRERADITQAELADELGISERSVWQFEKDGRIVRGRTYLDYIEAIEAIKARRANQSKAS